MTDSVPVPQGALSDERLEILKLVEDQTISAEEASRLLEALDRSDRLRAQETEPIRRYPSPPPPDEYMGRGRRSRMSRRSVRIRITDAGNLEPKVNLVLPGPLINSGLAMIRRFAPDSMIEASDIQESINAGFEGTLLDITDNGTRVEIIVE